MDARLFRVAIVAAALVSMGASHRTPNFIVNAPTAEIAAHVGQAAEKYRRDLAIEWLGQEMPNWSQPCPVTLEIGNHLGAGGATSFIFDHGEVFGWQMNIQGPLERILDSVLPHEVTHTVFATHFRQPLPRWADEGACTTVEHASEKQKHQKMLIAFLRTGRGIPFSQMFAMKEYPRDILPLYAQGHSLASFLLSQGGKQKYLKFVADGLAGEQWIEVTRQHYGFKDLADLQNKWLDWVRSGSPPLKPATSLASNTTVDGKRPRTEAVSSIYRAQSADDAPAKAPASWRPAASKSSRDNVAMATTPAGNGLATGVPMPSDNALAVMDQTIASRSLPKSDASERRVLVEWDQRAATAKADPPRPADKESFSEAARSIYDARPSSAGTLLR